jgi:hypothetical protein
VRQVVLKFPDMRSLAKFILSNRLLKIEAISADRTVKGTLPDEVIAVAETEFKAQLLFIKSS